MKKKNLLKQFSERYTIIEHDGGYLLYDKKGKARRANQLFKGRFYLSSEGKRFVFQDEYYNTPEELICAMEAWAATLPFSVELYNPAFKKSYFIECALYDYLESLGFEHERMSHNFILKDGFGKKLCSINYEVEDGKSCGDVRRPIDDKSWQHARFTDIDSAIAACNTLLSTYCIGVNAKVMGMMSKMTTSRVSSFFTKTFNIGTLTTYTEDAKQKAIQQLEEELKRLKGE